MGRRCLQYICLVWIETILMKVVERQKLNDKNNSKLKSTPICFSSTNLTYLLKLSVLRETILLWYDLIKIEVHTLDWKLNFQGKHGEYFQDKLVTLRSGACWNRLHDEIWSKTGLVWDRYFFYSGSNYLNFLHFLGAGF